VILFTRVAAREVAEVFSKNGNVCGKFRNVQLQRNLIVTNEKNSLWAAVSAMVITFLTIGNNETLAQNVDSKVNIINDCISIKPIKITGTISDENGALPGTSVYVRGTQVGTQSDINGNYTIEAKEGDILEYSMGYVPYSTKVKNENPINVKLGKRKTYIGNEVIIEQRTFFGRVFHSIGNWFR